MARFLSFILTVTLIRFRLRAAHGQGEAIVFKLARFVLDILLLFSLWYCQFNKAELGFVLSGMAYSNGSTVLRTDIGEGAAALQCTTDKVTCCTNQNGEIRAGVFYFPDGSQVPVPGNISSPYYRVRHSMSISLNRRSSIPTQPTGQFRCEIPDASGTIVNLFINIGRYS